MTVLPASESMAANPAARGHLTACAIILLIFTIAACMSAYRKPVTVGFDELAHVSYVAELQHQRVFWPNLDTLRMLDPERFEFTGEASYLNHPPFYYGLLALAAPQLEGRPQALLAHRAVNVAIAALGLAAILALALMMHVSRELLYAIVLPVALTPVLIPIAGAVNNDNLAFAGGAVTLLGLYAFLQTAQRRWLVCACLGVLCASAAKMTGLMLAGGLLVGGLLLAARRYRLTFADAILVAVTLVIGVAPYLALVLMYGSPAPTTPGQLAMLRDGADATGWSQLPRMDAVRYVQFFLVSFFGDWRPTLTPRSPLNSAALILPVVAVAIAVAGFILSLRRIVQRKDQAIDIVIVAGVLVIVATLAIHIGFAYQRHLATGWRLEAYPRYYLPLIAIVPIAGASVAIAIKDNRMRSAFIAFLIASPLAFAVLGAPLG